MAPTHVAPLVAERVVLEKELVLAVEQDGPIGVVDPSGRRVEVDLWLPGRRCRGRERVDRLLGEDLHAQKER